MVADSIRDLDIVSIATDMWDSGGGREIMRGKRGWVDLD